MPQIVLQRWDGTLIVLLKTQTTHSRSISITLIDLIVIAFAPCPTDSDSLYHHMAINGEVEHGHSDADC